jgi:hypothetical protein
MSVASDLPVNPTKAMVPLGDLQTFTVSTALGFYQRHWQGKRRAIAPPKPKSLHFAFQIAIVVIWMQKNRAYGVAAQPVSVCLFGGGRNEAFVRCHHDVLTTSYPHSLQIAGFYQFIRFAASPGRIFTLIPGY